MDTYKVHAKSVKMYIYIKYIYLFDIAEYGGIPALN